MSWAQWSGGIVTSVIGGLILIVITAVYRRLKRWLGRFDRRLLRRQLQQLQTVVADPRALYLYLWQRALVILTMLGAVPLILSIPANTDPGPAIRQMAFFAVGLAAYLVGIDTLATLHDLRGDAAGAITKLRQRLAQLESGTRR